MQSGFSLKDFQISASLEERVRIGLIRFDSLSIGEGHPDVTTAIEGITEELQRTLGDRLPSSISTVERTRRLYHQVGLDPTRHRPSSERLLRRVVRGKAMPRVNDFVDGMNLVSLRLQFPIGAYDADALAPPILLRVGMPNEHYRGLYGDMVGLEGKIILVDGEGPFGNPTHDSDRAAMTEKSVRALVVVFAPCDTPRHELEEAVQEIQQSAENLCHGHSTHVGILP
jgi:DNA/RNA-binding domain of Phe-tRNA-synthetase-like protein